MIALSGGVPVTPRASVVRTVGMALAVNCVTGLPYVLLGAAAVQVTGDLGFDEAGLGVVLSLFSIGGLTASPLAGQLIDRIGPSQGLRLASLLALATAAAVAVLGRTAWALAVIMFMAGVSSGITAPAANLWISRAVPHSRHGLAFGIKQSASPVGSIFAGLAVPLIVLTVGWRWAFGAVAVLAAAIFAAVPRLPRVSSSEQRDGHVGLRRLPLVVLAVGVALGFVAQTPVMSFFVASAVHEGMGEGTAGLLLAVGGVAAVVTRVAAGVVADRRSRGFLRGVAAMFVIGGALYVVLASGQLALIVVVTPLLFATANGWTGLLHLAVVESHPAAAGSATGIIMVGAFGGVVVGPILFGALADRSYALAWLVAGTCFVVGAVVVLFARSLLRATNAVEPVIAIDPSLPAN